MTTIAEVLGNEAIEKIQQSFELDVSQEVADIRVRDAKSPRVQPNRTNTKTHLWRGKPVTEKQFAHYARMSKEIPENSGSRAVFEVEQNLAPRPQIDPTIAKVLLLLLLGGGTNGGTAGLLPGPSVNHS